MLRVLIGSLDCLRLVMFRVITLVWRGGNPVVRKKEGEKEAGTDTKQHLEGGGKLDG